MFQGKPIIGLAGGIGSGKSFVAKIFAQLGCCVVDSDAQVRAAYEDPQVRQTLRQWWGEKVFRADGSVDRGEIASLVFANPRERMRLEQLLHPLVDRARRQFMQSCVADDRVVAFVWDTPLLFEAGLKDQCDAIVFVDAPLEMRWQRIAGRGWTREQLLQRENLQWPLDKKRELSDDIVVNAADAADVRSQVRDILSRVLARASKNRA